MEIELDTIINTPVFSVHSTSPHWSRVYGAIYIKKEQRWIFPAFAPFIENVLQDMQKVYKDVTLNKEAEEWCVKAGTADSWMATAQNLMLPVKSYEHQLLGLGELLYNYRWILQWEMGTGKSKVVVDAVQYLKSKALVLCPLVALDNWEDETTLHSEGTLSTLVLNGKSRTKKIEQLQAFEDYDIVVATYDTARNHGTPRIFPKTTKVFQNAMRFPHTALKKILKRLNDEKAQAQFARDWIKGKPPREIQAEIQELTGGKAQWIFDLPYDTVVADESHRIKRIQSMRTKVCLQLSQRASRRYLLSGTLDQGDPRDLFPQLRFLAPYLIPEDWNTFCETFLVKSPWNDKIVVGYQNLHILNSRVANVSSVKKLEECVDLPERRFETIYFNLSPAQRRDYNNIVKTNTIEQGETDPLELANGAIRISKLLQLCSGFVYVPGDTEVCDTCAHVRTCVSLSIRPGSNRCQKDALPPMVDRLSLRYPDNPKLSAMKDKLTDIVPTSKVIIWATFEQELSDVEEMLNQQKWGYVRVDGTTTKHIKKLAKTFNTEDACRVYLAQVSTGIAITLNAAKYTMYYSRDWSLENRLQSLFRNFRIGQDKKTIVYDFCARGSLETQQLTALQSKADTAKLLTEKQDCVMCSKYSACSEKNIAPWTTNCVLSTAVKKTIAKARMI